MRAVWLLLATCALTALRSHGQVPTLAGTVAASDAAVTIAGQQVLDVSGGRVRLTGNSSIKANPGRNAEVALARGGSVLLCQTSALHLSQSSDTSLLFALDRGAMEIRIKAGLGDVVVTPDLRLTMAVTGPLDLHMRVTRNGDTCVENRGRRPPALMISDAFGEASYLLKPGQHVLFEHGSVREVVDRETTPCGCPPEEQRRVPLAEAVLHGGAGPATPKQTEAANPFPIAESSGLAEPKAPAPEKPGETHVSASSTLIYDASPGSAPSPDQAARTLSSIVVAPRPQPEKTGPFRALGRFFKRLFVR